MDKILKQILIVIDKILNPRAYDYPFLYCNINEAAEPIILPKRHLIIRRFIEGDKYWIWCIRWL